ncbi:MAG: DUF5606 domain-containing protein [Bacteroidetes bacterium]|nr:DUF5606 domain-containing protein [Bacteroidota bacterium]
MSFEKIITIPGMSGLFKMIAQMRNGGFVVESLIDGRRQPVSSMQRITMLKDIAVFTMEDDVPLYDVFKKMKEHDTIASGVPAKADPADLKAALKKILPDFDDDRVHASDIRKMFLWYKLVKNDVGTEESDAAMKAEFDGEVPTKSSEVEEVVVEEPVKKKSVKKKTEDVVADGDAPAPKKKTAKTTKVKE